MTRFCLKCGNPVDPGAARCSRCKNLIPLAVDTTAPPPTTETGSPSAPGQPFGAAPFVPGPLPPPLPTGKERQVKPPAVPTPPFPAPTAPPVKRPSLPARFGCLFLLLFGILQFAACFSVTVDQARRDQVFYDQFSTPQTLTIDQFQAAKKPKHAVYRVTGGSLILSAASIDEVGDDANEHVSEVTAPLIRTNPPSRPPYQLFVSTEDAAVCAAAQKYKRFKAGGPLPTGLTASSAGVLVPYEAVGEAWNEDALGSRESSKAEWVKRDWQEVIAPHWWFLRADRMPRRPYAIQYYSWYAWCIAVPLALCWLYIGWCFPRQRRSD